MRVSWATTLVLALASPATAAHATDVTPVTGLDHPAFHHIDELMSEFIQERKIPGASVAIAKDGKLVYARGFGYADRDAKLPVQPTSRFRIASLSKTLTSSAALHLVQSSDLSLDARVTELLDITPYTQGNGELDPRIHDITVRHLLQQRSGLKREIPGGQLRGQTLLFPPGAEYKYSNFAYIALGHVISAQSGMSYVEYVQQQILRPLGIRNIAPARSALSERQFAEVRYYTPTNRQVRCVVPECEGELVPVPYGGWQMEGREPSGSWIGATVDMVKFASWIGRPQSPLTPASIATILARPPGLAGHKADGTPKAVYYGCGWLVRPKGKTGKVNRWHNGAHAGDESILVSLHNDITWAVFFNMNAPEGAPQFFNEIDPLLNGAIRKTKRWPKRDLFDRYL